jgi:hypothetical protein
MGGLARSAVMSPEDLHNIFAPLMLATGISLVCFALASALLWRHGREMKRENERRP